ncbi:MAG: hypothetical protein QXU20_02335 [Candidatus Woesearchaeota archaeon]
MYDIKIEDNKEFVTKEQFLYKDSMVRNVKNYNLLLALDSVKEMTYNNINFSIIRSPLIDVVNYRDDYQITLDTFNELKAYQIKS